MRTGIFLLAMIACTAAFGSTIAPEIYHSVVFYFLLGCLAVNTTLCSVGRLWKNRRSLDTPPDPQHCTFFFQEFVRDTDLARVRTTLEEMFKSAGFKTLSQADGNRFTLRGEKGFIGAWGIFGAHVSLVFIAAGVVCGAYAGYDETVALTEGTGHAIGRATEQPYIVRLNKFATLYYEDGTVSDWLSDVTVERDGQILARKDIKVNHPLTFHGHKVYLASQGVVIQTRVVDRDNNILSNVDIAPGDEVGLPGSDGKSLRILRYIPDYDPLQPMVSKTPQPRNPYVIYVMQRDGKPERRQAVPLNNPQPIDGGAFLVFPQVAPVAGLHVKYDPGLPFIWAGFGLLVSGLCFSYFTPYRQVWAYTVREKGGFTLTCAGRGPNLAGLRDKMRCSLTAGSDH